MFDTIFAINVLQFIDGDTIFDTIAQMQNKTSVGGFNIIAAFVAETVEQKEEFLLKGMYFFDEGELQSLYRDWNILLYTETLGNWETH
jgi:tellurite methyltransferase